MTLKVSTFHFCSPSLTFTHLLVCPSMDLDLPDLLLSFPNLPLHDIPWSLNVNAAFDALRNAYSHALQVLRQEADPI